MDRRHRHRPRLPDSSCRLALLGAIIGGVAVTSASLVPHHTQPEPYKASNIVQELSTNISSSSLLPELDHQQRYESITQECIDLRDECAERKAKGSCEKDVVFMTHHCARTCDLCHHVSNLNQRQVSIEEAWTTPKKVFSANLIIDGMGSDTGIVQSIPGKRNRLRLRVVEHIQKQRIYLEDEIYSAERYKPVRETCRNDDHECTIFAVRGECKKRPKYMDQHCPFACFTCHLLDLRLRCPVDRNAKNALYPGDLNRMFQRIVNDPYFVSEYNMTILSQPGDTSKNRLDADVDTGGPWIIQLDNFFGAEESERLLEWGAQLGFSRSTVLHHDTAKDDGHVSDYRTSDTAWCDGSPCNRDSVVLGLFERMENLTHVSRKNSESLQLLRYGVGGYYKEHNDYIDTDINRSQGVRILTVFLYLNGGGDAPLQGGGTHFPKLGLTVQPRRGRAVIWPSVLDDDPHQEDPRTLHEALNVTKGQKFGANAWLHQREFKKGC